MPKTILLSVCSIVMPSGYSNDNRSQHPRLKGGLFLMLNYFFTNLVLGVALGFSILRHVPNIFQGVKLPPLAADIRVSIVYKLSALTRCNVYMLNCFQIL